MIYICADDYGMCAGASERILRCATEGALNKISVFPNFEMPDLQKLASASGAKTGLHLNLVEGKALCSPGQVSLLTDSHGRFIHTFSGLFVLSVIKRKEFEKQIYAELKAQIDFWLKTSDGAPLMIDSHQHTHMIPAVFRVLMRVLADGGIKVEYMRFPSEPVLPYILCPSLYITYSPVNLVKQWLLKFFGLVNKGRFKKSKIPTAYFMGILFSGMMDEKRVRKVLPHYIKKAEKSGDDLEILFHPGYTVPGEELPDMCNPEFKKFYLSTGRRAEYDAVMNLKNYVERSVL